jgi:hypothetical protein
MSIDFVKQTLRENLSRVLIPHVADGLWSIYDNAKIACERNKQPEQTLRTFQNLLTRVPQWNDETLNTEVDRISVASKCDYIEDLLLGVFVSYIRAFASMQQLESTHVDINFDRPSVSKFIHSLYKSAARHSWSNAYLFKTIGVSSEQQARNRRDIETMLGNSLNEVIDGFIPWKEISKAYFQARKTSEPVEKESPPPASPSIKIEEDKNEIVEFEEEEEEEEEEPPRIQLGEDIELDVEDADAKSVDTNTELEEKASKEETISLNI